jgi:hypothetical protein
MPRAFALRKEYEGTVTVFDTAEDEAAGNGREVPKYGGGVFNVSGRSVNLGELVEQGGGKVVIDDNDGALLATFEENPAFKEVAVQDDEPTASEYDALSRSELRERAHQRGFQGAGNLRADDLRSLLKEHDAAQQAGDQERAQALLTDPTNAVSGEESKPDA